MGAAPMPQPQGAGQNPGGSLSSIYQFMKQFLGGAGNAAQAAGTPGGAPGGNQTPAPQPVQNPSLMSGQPNSLLETIGRTLLGKVAGSPGSQDTTQLKKAIDDHMKVLDQQKKAAQHVRKAVTAAPASDGPTAQADPSQPFHDLFHSVMSGLQS